MFKQAKKKPNGLASSPATLVSGLLASSAEKSHLTGMLYLVVVLMCLSVLAGARFVKPMRLFVAGEIASHDVTSDQDLLLEDMDSTRRKREQVAGSQPPVYDLSREPGAVLRRKVLDIFARVSQAPADDLEQVRWQVAEELNAEISVRTLALWRSEEVQSLFIEQVLPWTENYLRQGVAGEKRVLLGLRTGIIVRDLVGGQERLKIETQDLRDLNDLSDDLENYLKQDMKKPLRLRRAVIELVLPLVGPSLTLNQGETQSRVKEAMDAVEPVYYQIKKGEVVVRQGERVGPDQQLKIQAVFSERRERFDESEAMGVFLVGLLFVIGLFLSSVETRFKNLLPRDALFLGSLVLFTGVLAKLLSILKGPLSLGIAFALVQPGLFAYMLPMAGAVGVLALFFPLNICIFANLFLSFIGAKLVGEGFGPFLFYFLGGMFNTFFVKRAQNRLELLTSVFPLLGALTLSWSGVALLEDMDGTRFWAGMVMVAVSGFFSLLWVLAISPIVEHLYGYTSRFKLLELMNLEQPLLQDLMVNAPGTYHHSLVVANMVESGARVIGANPLLAKVAALYHDIGKLRNPSYYIENQFGQANRHDKLAPSMSALVIISHVKKGVELAREHKLGPEIVDVIRQHHGTSLISYFYHKAQEQAEARGDDPVREDDYRYPGPKPQTREAGLILLADAIEASGRTLVDPTPSRIKGHIEKMIHKIFNEGQLDECELTLRDLHKLADAFQRILTGIFHSRIEYPDAAKADGQDTPAAKGQPVPRPVQ